MMVNSDPKSFGPDPRFTMLRYVSRLPPTPVRQRYPRSMDPVIQDSSDGTGVSCACASADKSAKNMIGLISAGSCQCGSRESSDGRRYSSGIAAIADRGTRAAPRLTHSLSLSADSSGTLGTPVEPA